MKKLLLQATVGIAVAILMTLLYLKLPQEFATFDSTLRDYLFKLRGPIPTTDNIVIIDLDEKSLKELGQWPWPRQQFAQLLTNLTEAGVGIIGLDIVFAEKDNSSPKEVFRRLGLPSDHVPDYDQILGQTIAQTPTIVGYFFALENDGLKPDGLTPNIPAIFIERKGENQEFLIQPYRPILNIPAIQNQAYSSGFFTMIPDADGIVRSVPLLLKYDGMIFPSLAFELIRIASGVKKVTINYSEVGVEEITLGKLAIPTDRNGRIFVNYRGPSHTFPYISATDVINKRIDPNLLNGKIALIGTSAAGLLDLRSTPFDNVFPGVEVHANIIDNIIAKDFIARPSWMVGVDLTLIIGAALIMAILYAFTPALIALTLALLAAAGLLIFDYWMLFSQGLIVNILFPLTTLLVIFLISMVLSYLLEARQKELIKNKFAKKVSPAVVEKLISNPDDMILDGEERYVTIFFSDIRGFTTLSEAMGSPKRLVQLLNRYMTPMTDIIIAHQGTIDKFIGDAIMSYWNAPNDVPNHEDEAVTAAIEQIEKLKELNAELAAEGTPPIDIGIGINTGLSTVGEMGSKGRADYTIIGDPVNLASRLEGLNKPYGSHIIISEFTKKGLKKEYVIRHLDLVRVKGKNKPVEIFEVLGFGPVTPEQQAMIDRYHEAIALYNASDFAGAKAIFEELEAKEHDQLYTVYIERCDHFIKNPPVAFDGVFTFTTK